MRFLNLFIFSLGILSIFRANSLTRDFISLSSNLKSNVILSKKNIHFNSKKSKKTNEANKYWTSNGIEYQSYQGVDGPVHYSFLAAIKQISDGSKLITNIRENDLEGMTREVIIQYKDGKKKLLSFEKLLANSDSLSGPRKILVSNENY